MSFVVCRMDKMKAPALRGIQFHNQRERESWTNFDVVSPDLDIFVFRTFHKRSTLFRYLTKKSFIGKTAK
ncbi:hypothetical protein AWH48_18055 [Domibacillus aminovorans]|uniref:Uncharacterized protein n=1 Tax=Domibacillus aminovorans TaxID=29332 RepID=A0A177KZK4_9BACI|nr:hypothetical protein AWH48_18055 [Domibacillus aminovorans]